MIVEPSQKVTSIGDFYELKDKIHESLHQLDIFESVDITLSPSSPEDIEKNLDDPLDCTLTFTFVEKKRFAISTSIAANEKSETGMENKISVHNYFGHAEKFNYNYALSREAAIYKASMFKPIYYKGQFHTWTLGGYNDKIDHGYLSSLSENKWTAFTNYQIGSHEVGYELSLRDLTPLEKGTEYALKEGGFSSKSCFKYAYQYDDRDDRLFPTQGKAFRVATELAGLLGSTKHARIETDMNINTTLSGIGLQCIARTGILKNLKGTTSKISDRFFLGGATTFKGFQTGGMGPNYKIDALGGEAYWTIGTHMTYPIKKMSSMEIYGHAYIQAGNNVMMKDIGSIVKGNEKNPIRAMSGLGIALKLMGCRLDFLYNIPIRTSKYDKVSPIQVGITINIL